MPRQDQELHTKNCEKTEVQPQSPAKSGVPPSTSNLHAANSTQGCGNRIELARKAVKIADNTSMESAILQTFIDLHRK